MYGHTGTGLGGALAVTGSTLNVMWVAAAGFALFAVGIALIRLAPKGAKV